MTNTFFVADTHFSHPAILYFKPKRREAAGITLEELQEDKNLAVEKHDEWLIDTWNSTVGRNDSVYILGDFCLGNKERAEKVLHQLRGKKFLIEGNHDRSLHGLERYFEWYGQIKEAKFNNQMFDFIDPKETFCVEMCHYPMLTWNRRPHGSVHAHGHVHGTLDKFNNESLELRIDVGLDAAVCGYNLTPLEVLYNHFTELRNKAGCATFQDYQEWLMQNQGFRM